MVVPAALAGILSGSFSANSSQRGCATKAALWYFCSAASHKRSMIVVSNLPSGSRGSSNAETVKAIDTSEILPVKPNPRPESSEVLLFRDVSASVSPDASSMVSSL